ncbi:GNA1162 family protein, partial [Achromobacter xylosoxidans]
VDYAAFRESKPASILVLPPLNTSVDVAAGAAVLAQATMPLAESGYYVVPVAVMEETFKQNGLTNADEIHELPAARLREIFGADAALYMTVKQYGSSYAVLSSSIT